MTIGAIRAATRQLISPRPATDDDAETRAAFTRLFEEQSDRIFAFLRFRVGDAAVAEDLTAEVFARAWAKRTALRSSDAAVGWLFAMARNLAVDHHRRRRPTASLDALVEADHPLAPSAELAASGAFDAEAVARLLAGLTAREREVIGLRFVVGLRNGEIATVVNTSEGNVAKIVHRALAKLRAALPEGARDV